MVDKCCSDDVLVKNDMSVIVYYDVDETFLFDNEQEMDEFLFKLIKKAIAIQYVVLEDGFIKQNPRGIFNK